MVMGARAWLFRKYEIKIGLFKGQVGLISDLKGLSFVQRGSFRVAAHKGGQNKTFLSCIFSRTLRLSRILPLTRRDSPKTFSMRIKIARRFHLGKREIFPARCVTAEDATFFIPHKRLDIRSDS